MGFKINLGVLSVTIGADTKNFDENTDKVDKKLGKTTKELRKSSTDFVKWGAAAAAASVVAVAAFAKMNLAAIKELKILAQQSNVTVKEFQQGAFAAEQFGIETEKYGDILKDVNDRVGDFLTTGGGPMIDFFEKIAPKVGVTIEQFKGLSGQEALGLYVDSLEKANVSQEEMVFFMEAMASDSTRLIPLFTKNGEALKEMTVQAEKLGIGLSDLDLIKAGLASKELNKSAAAADAFQKRLTIELAPAITGITKAINQAAMESGGWGDVTENVIDFMVKGLGVLWNAVRGIQVIFKGVEVVARAAFFEISKVIDVFINSSIREIGRAIVDFVTRPLRKTLQLAAMFSDTAQEMLEGVNKLIDDTIGGRRDTLGEFASSQVDALKKSKEEFQAMLLEELPASKLAKFVNNSRKAFADEVSKVKNKKDKDKKDKDSKDTPPPVADIYKTETIGLLEAMGLRFESTDELQLAQYEKELEMLKDRKDKGFVLDEEFAKKTRDLEKKMADAKRAHTLRNVNEGFMLLATNSKKVNKIMKAAAIAQALIKGKQAAVDAWQAGMSWGVPWAPAIAAAYTVASLAKTASLISSIRSGGGGGGGGGGSLPSAATGRTQQQQQSPGQTTDVNGGTARNIEINITGESGGLFSTEMVRDLIEKINEQVGDGVNLATAGV